MAFLDSTSLCSPMFSDRLSAIAMTAELTSTREWCLTLARQKNLAYLYHPAGSCPAQGFGGGRFLTGPV